MGEQSRSVAEMHRSVNPARNRGIGTSFGANVAALLASLCCIGPVLFVTLGVGASFARRFEPLRPVFTILAVALIAAGFYAVYGRGEARVPDATCEVNVACRAPRTRIRDKVVVWVAALIAMVLLMFPQWSLWIM